MKECPDCSMFNAENATKCKFCGATLKDGGSSDYSGPSSVKKAENPEEKAKREKDEKRRKIITYAGYGVIAAALVGWVIYMQYKKSKEPPPEKDVAAQVTKGDGSIEATTDAEKPSTPKPAGVEEALPRLGDRISLEGAGFSLRPFDKASVVGKGDAAETDPGLFFEATSKDGTVGMTVRRVRILDGTEASLDGALGAQLVADYIVAKGRIVTLPGKKKGKTAAGQFVMFEADLGDTFERVYYVLGADALIQVLFSYPSKDDNSAKNERIIDEIFASIEKAAGAPSPQAPAATTAATDKDKPALPDPLPSPAPATKKVPEKAPAPKPEKVEKPASTAVTAPD